MPSFKFMGCFIEWHHSDNFIIIDFDFQWWQRLSLWWPFYIYADSQLNKQEQIGEWEQRPYWSVTRCHTNINTLRARENGQYLANGIFKCIFLNAKVWILMKMSQNIIFLRVWFQLVSIGCSNGLVPNRQQAMVWTNVDDAYMSHTGVDELKEICGSG